MTAVKTTERQAMNLGEFIDLTKDLPENTEILIKTEEDHYSVVDLGQICNYVSWSDYEFIPMEYYEENKNKYTTPHEIIYENAIFLN